MRLRSLLSRLSKLGSHDDGSSAAMLKAAASFWGFMPEARVAAWGRLALGEAAAVTAAMRLESPANGSFSAEHAAAPLHEHQQCPVSSGQHS